MKLNKRERIGVLVSAIWLVGTYLLWADQVDLFYGDVNVLIAWWAPVPIAWLIYWVMKAK